MAQEKKPAVKSTQSYLTLSEIKSGTLITENGNMSSIIAVSSTNFALKSQEEQQALIYGYQNFLNSIDFPIQILMQSRKMDVHVYLEKVRKVMEQQTNELLRVQTAEYIEFISKLIENASVMNKNFYIVVSYNPGALPTTTGGFLSLFRKKTTASDSATEKFRDFQDKKTKLDQRVNTVIAGLSALGLKCLPLGTEEITELLYQSYNLDAGALLDADKIESINLTERK